MRAFFAVAKQTVSAAFRSKVFHILIGLTLLAVFVLPLTASSDGTVSNELKLSITYSLTVVSALLSIAAVWIGGTGPSQEIENYRLQMVTVKPVRTIALWGGKWCGVFILTGSVFLFSSLLIFLLVQYRIHTGNLPEEELAEARREILTGRRVYQPVQPDYQKIVQQKYKQLKKNGNLPADKTHAEIMQGLQQSLKKQIQEVPYKNARTWKYTDLKVPDADSRISVRYRLYVASAAESQQRITEGKWIISTSRNPSEEETAVLPQRVVGGAHHEFSFPAETLNDKDTVYIQYVNEDSRQENIVFQTDDSPKILCRVSGFTANWLRATIVIMLRLAVLSAVGCLFGVAFSPPVAVFMAAAYLILGAIATPTIGTTAGNLTGSGLMNLAAHIVAVTVDKIVVSLNAFDVSFLLAKGRLIEMSKIAKLLIFEVLLKGGITAALGIWILRSRELGKVIRK